MCKKCARKKEKLFSDSAEKSLLSFRHIISPTSNMSRNPSIRENMKKRLLPHFYRFLLVSGTLWRSLLFILTPKIVLSASHKQHLAFFRSFLPHSPPQYFAPPSYTHFFVMLHKHGRIGKFLLLWIDDMPSWKILSLEEEIFEKYFARRISLRYE